MTTKLTEKNISSVANAGINWQSVIVADGSTGTTGVAGRGYFINTTSAAHTFTLPATATFADTILIKDYAGTFATFNLTIARNGHNIQGVANNSLISTNRASVVLVYVDVTRGWEFVTESNVADLGEPLFVTATGGTITTSGDFKIHSFTGDGCFAVSQIGNGPTVPTGGPNTVSYLVVAGGGGGGNGNATGGGGAGGFREGRDIVPSYTASPLVAPTGLTITATTYPISVGAGGPLAGAGGSNSSFSTITSAGGGGSAQTPSGPSYPGGSGGGGSYAPAAGGGTGNTPPTSPPQGNNGGTANPATPNTNIGSGGGGGATAVGGNASAPRTAAGAGGAGATTSITGSPVAYSGGGGGGVSGPAPQNNPGGAGGTGGGGTGGGPTGSPSESGTNGSANTGGGGAGGGGTYAVSASPGGLGGKGIVIIRYKFQ
jgi:hypothetical protein